MIRTLIVEDENHALDLLSSILEEYCPEIQLLGAASSLSEGKLLIDSLEPELVFLDIQLGTETGFELLNEISHKNFKLIITSAFDHYALEGFKHEATDYILKPYSPKQILTAVNRVMKQRREENVFNKLSSMIRPQSQLAQTKLSIATAEGIHLVDYDDIIRLEAQKAYCEVLIKNQPKLLVSKSIGEIEKQLPESKFFRVHSGHLVQLASVMQISNLDGGYLIMTDGSQVPLARRRKNEFMAAIQA